MSTQRAAVVAHQEEISENLLEVSPNLDFLYGWGLCSSVTPLFTNNRRRWSKYRLNTGNKDDHKIVGYQKSYKVLFSFFILCSFNWWSQQCGYRKHNLAEDCPTINWFPVQAAGAIRLQFRRQPEGAHVKDGPFNEAVKSWFKQFSSFHQWWFFSDVCFFFLIFGGGEKNLFT